MPTSPVDERNDQPDHDDELGTKNLIQQHQQFGNTIKNNYHLLCQCANFKNNCTCNNIYEPNIHSIKTTYTKSSTQTVKSILQQIPLQEQTQGWNWSKEKE